MRDASLPAPPTGYAGQKYRVVQLQHDGTVMVWGWTNAEDGGALAIAARQRQADERADAAIAAKFDPKATPVLPFGRKGRKRVGE